MIRAFFILSVSSLSFISCKKDYTCSCEKKFTVTAYTEYGDLHPETTDVEYFNSVSKSNYYDAVISCEEKENTRSQTFGNGEARRTATETVSCELN